MHDNRDILINVDCPLLDDPVVVAWLLSGFAPLCYPDCAADDPEMRAVILAYDCGDGPHAPAHDPQQPREVPRVLWDFVCQAVADADLDDQYCYVRLQPCGG